MMTISILPVGLARAEERVLGAFARRANGMTGADVEYVVQQAKRAARRKGRPLEYIDVENALEDARPQPPEDLRLRFSHHEAAHVVVGMALHFKGFDKITLGGGDSDPSVTAAFFKQDVVTEIGVMSLISVGLAGRAAEELIFDNASIYSGGGRGSDLARVTKLAYMLETSFGFGAEQKLVYREYPDFVTGMASDPTLLARINGRLELAYLTASQLVTLHRNAIEHLAEKLIEAGTLDGANLQDVLGEVSAIMERDDPAS